MGKMESQTPMLLAFGSDELAALNAKMDAIMAKLEGATIKPRDEWETVEAFAGRVGRTVQTVRLWVRQGKIDSRRAGGVLLVRG